MTALLISQYSQRLLTHSSNQTQSGESQCCALLNSSIFSSRKNEIKNVHLHSGAGSEFHVDGSAMAKLRGPKQVVNVTRTAAKHRQKADKSSITEEKNTYALDIEHFADAIEHVVRNASEATGDTCNAISKVVWHRPHHVTHVTH